MSTKASARIDLTDDSYLDDVDLDTDVNLVDVGIIVGDAVDGHMYLAVHTCPECFASMQTMGVAHGKYYCSWCKAGRSRDVEMNLSLTPLEIME